MKNNIRASCPRSNTAPKTWGLCCEARRPYTGYLLDVMSGALPGPVVRLPRFPGPNNIGKMLGLPLVGESDVAGEPLQEAVGVPK